MLNAQIKTTFSTFEVCEVIEVDHERLRQWLRRGDVQATKPAEGQGTKAEWTGKDTYKAEFYKRMVDTGYRREVAAGVVKQLDDTAIMSNILVYAVEAGKNGTRFFSRTFLSFEKAVEFMRSYTWREVRIADLAGLRRHVDERMKKL